MGIGQFTVHVLIIIRTGLLNLLSPDAVLEDKMVVKNTLADGALPRTPLGANSAPQTP